MSSVLQLSMLMNALFLSMLLATAHGLLKWVARKEVANYFELITNYWLVIGTSLAIYGFIFFFYIYVLQRNDITKLYPTYTGLSILLVLLVGTLFFGETLNRVQSLGCVFVILGIFLVSK